MALPLAIRKVVRANVPWWAKGALKLTLSRLPVDYKILRSLALARHGGMERPEWADETFRQFFNDAKFSRKDGGFTALELGPGDSLFMALIAKAFGASATYHVDVRPCANRDPHRYRQMAAFLQARGLPTPDLTDARSLGDVLAACNAVYLTQGLASLQGLPDHSVDFIFSNSVLQHVRQRELPATLMELRRIIDPGGCSVHAVDLRDMMGQSLHHLRFSSRIWESDWFRNADFYTNRMRLSELVAACKHAGFSVDVIENNRWPRLPIPRRQLAPPYRNMAVDDLLTATVRLVLRPHT